MVGRARYGSGAAWQGLPWNAGPNHAVYAEMASDEYHKLVRLVGQQRAVTILDEIPEGSHQLIYMKLREAVKAHEHTVAKTDAV